MDVSIVIPTKNGGQQLKDVLTAVFGQKTSYSYEVICVDSGSSDNTLDIINGFDCRLFQIPAKDFGHGKTRNFGAFKGTGEFIIFITQDAVPASEHWLQNFIDAMQTDKSIVGGFGVHYPYPDCNVFDKRDLELHFKGFGTENTVYSLEDPERYKTDEGYRHFLAFFSDNNSCVRRSVFEKYPYDDVNFAEDQIWCRKMIELGYKKIYCANAPVYHSHNYSLSTYFKRYYDEFKSLYELHKFIIVKHWYLTVPAAIKHIISDIKYLRTIVLPKRKKIYWAYYSFVRNLYRYIGGYIGGIYHTFSKKGKKIADKLFSQQYVQKNK
ncbi:MAG: glycosyltransferase family 2 protein [Clostridia bacterium]|nr:glycosyltransferase family 2 protein [Clostridia bacterium]